jgi:hypothetical protein
LLKVEEGSHLGQLGQSVKKNRLFSRAHFTFRVDPIAPPPPNVETTLTVEFDIG